MRSSLLSMLVVTSAGMLFLEGNAFAQAPTSRRSAAAPPVVAPPCSYAGARLPRLSRPLRRPIRPMAQRPLLLPCRCAACAPPVLAPEPPPPLAPIGAATPSDGSVEIHITSPRTVSLERRAAPGAPWEHVCESPCDARSPAVSSTGSSASISTRLVHSRSALRTTAKSFSTSGRHA